MAQREFPLMSVEDYLILDQSSQQARYEYLDGELRMLAGGTADHSIITTDLTVIIHGLLRGRACRVYNSDMRFQLSESRYVYPDITITCDQRDQMPIDDMTHFPCVVVEVLSPSTEAIDRGKKFFYYRVHPSIQEYMMVDSQSIQIEVYRREEDGWKLHTYGPESIVSLECLDIQFAVDTLYSETSLMRKSREQ